MATPSSRKPTRNPHHGGVVHVQKGDTVRVSMGRDRGVQAKVLRVFPQKATVLVDGVNIITKAVKPNEQNQGGGFEQRSAPIHLGKVRLVCPSCSKVTRVGSRLIETVSGPKKVRYCKKCNSIIESNESEE
jgi:large subunit ribosomal protein L24